MDASVTYKKTSFLLTLPFYTFLLGIQVDLSHEDEVNNICAGIKPVHLTMDIGVIVSNERYPLPENTTGCRMWYIQGHPKEIIIISFDDLDLPTTDPSMCTGGQVLLGPEPEKTLCGSLRYKNVTERVYISHRNHMWIKYLHFSDQLGRGFKLTYVRGSSQSDPCPFPYHKCDSGVCILDKWLCNGAEECPDGSDEVNCTNEIIPSFTMAPFDCGDGFFRCADVWHEEVRCFPKSYLCDGKPDCIDGKDEENCGCEHYVDGPFGVITSPHYPQHYPRNTECRWIIHVQSGSQIQFRFSDFTLDEMGGDYIEIRDHSYDGLILAKLDWMNPPLKLIESYSNIAALIFHTDDAGMAMGFNVTYQQKGVCFSGQAECGFGENDCYDKTVERCDSTWNCPLHGGDERGCGHCSSDKFSCGSGTQCYREEDRCNGIVHCSNKADEKGCSARICGPHNGTFLCHNQMCIYESWHCDGANDCGDNSDEIDCPLSRKVVTAAVIGSLICALLLTIALGCTRQLHALRQREQYNRQRYRSPLTRLQEEIFANRLAPPNYNEAMITSRPFEEVQREFLEQMQAALAANGEVDLQNLLMRVMSPPTDRNHNEAQNTASSTSTRERPSRLTQTEHRYSIASDISDDTMTNLCAGLASHIAEMAESSNVRVNISGDDGISAQWQRSSQPKHNDASCRRSKRQTPSSNLSDSEPMDRNTEGSIINGITNQGENNDQNTAVDVEQSGSKPVSELLPMQQMGSIHLIKTDNNDDFDDATASTSSFQSSPDHRGSDGESQSSQASFSDTQQPADAACLDCDRDVLPALVLSNQSTETSAVFEESSASLEDDPDSSDTRPLIC